ncbi:metal dependent phosphohydrolase [Desulfofarcimen acetoxidans DSM 771]|jgi:predicted HD superfamily hydrolase involved in NAD metabolism|uniref:bis(5'-nucleosyl)-tetraphosphatase (symmetrical) n=1 Tax=Desulfofarcimen acetoxidans (strain ATCC 49208 / DSM 771 / KCTC 5769 / VKM B-1644 / 5575) TaxID=485916 RepID=C8W5N9_DESAS|nr:bis(5'-nucleosyl)-tetraphosphatase (symmetrical) YqeK [Desulfofarcimen acetoxidans]ACV64039.1 metal dependent phosphohydrolase [Desulfofarcimen acetoxidans DSM 771]
MEKTIIKKLSGMVNGFRLQHSLAVRDIAVEMARCFGADGQKANLAALLHDCARDFSPARLLSKARAAGINVTEVDEMLPELLHAPVGALLVQEEFGITDPEIIQAVSCHTVGAVKMTVLDKIIFIADLIEPSRKGDLDKVRQLAYTDLEEALLAAFDFTLQFIIKTGSVIDCRTVQARNEVLRQKTPFLKRKF